MSFFLYSYINNVTRKGTSKHKYLLLKMVYMGTHMVTLAPTGGRISAPSRRVFVDNGKTAARSAAKFGMNISSFFYTLCASCSFLT